MEIVYSVDGLQRLPRRVGVLGARQRQADDLPRPLPRGLDRGRRRRALRRRGRLDRRDHAARRGGRNPLRRLRLRAAAALARRARCSTQIREPDGGDREGARRRRPAERPVRDPRAARLLRDRGQPARVADGAVRLQGDRPAGREARLPDHARRADRRPRPAGETATATSSASRRRCCRSTASPAPTSLLGPEMRSTGEVMGIARDFPTAFAKAQAAAGAQLPDARHRRSSRSPTATSRRPPAIAIQLHDLGFKLLATRGTAQAIERMGIPARHDQQDRRGLAARASTRSSAGRSTS